MTAQQKISNLYQNKRVDEICQLLAGDPALAQDLKQDVILILLELPEEKINAISEGLLNYFFIIAKNLIRDNKRFIKKYFIDQDSGKIFEENKNNESFIIDEKEICNICNKIKNLDFLRKEIYKLFLSGKKIKEITKDTKIWQPYLIKYIYEANKEVIDAKLKPIHFKKALNKNLSLKNRLLQC